VKAIRHYRYGPPDVLGSSVVSASNLPSFTEAWWWAGGFALVAAIAALAITPRRRAVTSPSAAMS